MIPEVHATLASTKIYLVLGNSMWNYSNSIASASLQALHALTIGLGLFPHIVNKNMNVNSTSLSL